MINKTKREIPLLGLGTWGIGGRRERDESNREVEVESVREALKIGYRLIDTAEIYGMGLAEEVVGEAIKGFDRQELFIVSKVWPDYLKFDDVLKAAEGSLRRLQTDYLDCYLIHWPNDAVPIEETVRALRKLKGQKLIKSFGVSNFDVQHLKGAFETAGKEIAVNQIEYNVLNQEAAKEIIPFCKKNNIDVMAYRPLAKGNFANNKKLKTLAEKYQCTESQIALAWVIGQGITAIPKALKKEHLESNWSAQKVALSAEDLSMLCNF